MNIFRRTRKFVVQGVLAETPWRSFWTLYRQFIWSFPVWSIQSRTDAGAHTDMDSCFAIVTITWRQSAVAEFKSKVIELFVSFLSFLLSFYIRIQFDLDSQSMGMPDASSMQFRARHSCWISIPQILSLHCSRRVEGRYWNPPRAWLVWKRCYFEIVQQRPYTLVIVLDICSCKWVL